MTKLDNLTIRQPRSPVTISFYFDVKDGDRPMEVCRWKCDENGVLDIEILEGVSLTEAAEGIIKCIKLAFERQRPNGGAT